jgi:hypothetical protein
MAYELCKICEEKTANPLHVKSAHDMNFSEYKKMIENEDFMQDVAKHRKLREEKEAEEYKLKRILAQYWFPKAGTLTGVMQRYLSHAKPAKEAFVGQEIDISRYVDKDEANVPTIELAEALMKSGEWVAVAKKGGHDGSPKQYIMKRK